MTKQEFARAVAGCCNRKDLWWKRQKIFRREIRKIQGESFDLVLVDVMLPDGKGIDLLEPIRQRDPETISIIITGYATVELAVETIKKGAYNFISKPFTADMLLLTVNQGLEKRRLSMEAKRLQTIERDAVELTRARDEAERLNEFKSSFLLMMAHELRSPVSGAQSLVRTLLRGLAGELKPQQTELLSRVEIRLNFVLEMINDILTLASSRSIETDSPLEQVQYSRCCAKSSRVLQKKQRISKVYSNFKLPVNSLQLWQLKMA